MPNVFERQNQQFDVLRAENRQRGAERRAADNQRKNAGREQLAMLSQYGGLGKGVAHQQQTRNALLGQMSGGVQQPVNEAARSQAQAGYGTVLARPEGSVSSDAMVNPQVGQNPLGPPPQQFNPQDMQRFQTLQASRRSGLDPQTILAQQQQQRQNQLGNRAMLAQIKNTEDVSRQFDETQKTKRMESGDRRAAAENVAAAEANSRIRSQEIAAEAQKFAADKNLSIAIATGDAALAVERLRGMNAKDAATMNAQMQTYIAQLQSTGQLNAAAAQNAGLAIQALTAAAGNPDASPESIQDAMARLQQVLQLGQAAATGKLNPAPLPPSFGNQSPVGQGTVLAPQPAAPQPLRTNQTKSVLSLPEGTPGVRGGDVEQRDVNVNAFQVGRNWKRDQLELLIERTPPGPKQDMYRDLLKRYDDWRLRDRGPVLKFIEDLML